MRHGTVADGKADHSGRQREIRCGLHVQRSVPRGKGGQHGQLLRTGLLSCLYGGRPLRQPAQGADDQLLCLRLQLLRQPQVQRCAPRHLFAVGAGRADHRVLPPQLHRGAVPVQRGADQPGLHHRADAQDPAPAAERIPFRRVHPRQGHPRHQPGTAGAAGFSGRPSERQCGTAQREQPETAGPGQGAALHLPAHEADRSGRSRQPGGTDPLPQSAPVRARRSEHPDDRGGFAGDGSSHPQADRGNVPEIQPQAGVLLRLHPRGRGYPPARAGHQAPAAAGAPALSGGLAAAVLPVQSGRDLGRRSPELQPLSGPEMQLGGPALRAVPGGREPGPLRDAAAGAGHRPQECPAHLACPETGLAGAG